MSARYSESVRNDDIERANMIAETTKQFCRTLKDKCDWNPQRENPPAWVRPELTIDTAKAVLAALQVSETRIRQLSGTCRQLDDRKNQLEQSYGAAVADRDNGIHEAQKVAAGAELLAADIAKKAGMEPDIAVEVAKRNKSRQRYIDELESRIRNLEMGRKAMVGLWDELRRKSGGLTEDEVRKVVRALERINEKAKGVK